jgi:hypothetical protein
MTSASSVRDVLRFVVDVNIKYSTFIPHQYTEIFAKVKRAHYKIHLNPASNADLSFTVDSGQFLKNARQTAFLQQAQQKGQAFLDDHSQQSALSRNPSGLHHICCRLQVNPTGCLTTITLAGVLPHDEMLLDS